MKNPMKDYLYYVLRSYLWTVAAICIVVAVDSTITYYGSNKIGNDSPFSSPLFAILSCGLICPISNLPVILALYKYRFSKVEVVVESIIFLYVATYFTDIVKTLVHLKNGRAVTEMDLNNQTVWWYYPSLNIIYAIILMILICLIYFKVKENRPLIRL